MYKTQHLNGKLIENLHDQMGQKLLNEKNEVF